MLTQPDALLVARDVLDFERDGAAVRGAKIRQYLSKGATGHVDTEQVGGDLLHHLLGEAVRRRVHRRIADRRRTKRIQVRAEVTVSSVCLDERCGRLHGTEEDPVG